MAKDPTGSDRAPQVSRLPLNPRARDWNSRVLLACNETTLFGQIIRAAMRLPSRIATSCIVTSDGYCMAGYTDGSGTHHHGALICSVDDLRRNFQGVCKHLDFGPQERDALRTVLQGWIVTDYSGLAKTGW